MCLFETEKMVIGIEDMKIKSAIALCIPNSRKSIPIAACISDTKNSGLLMKISVLHLTLWYILSHSHILVHTWFLCYNDL